MGEIRRFAIADACSVYGESLRTKPSVAASASIVRERKEMTGLITTPPRRLQIGSGFAADSPLEEAVRSELVSETQFPC
jgi:hypothetical protein